MINFYVETPIDRIIKQRIFTFGGWLASDQPIETMKLLINREEFRFLVAYGRDDVANGTGLLHAIGWVAHIPIENFLISDRKVCIIQIVVNGNIINTEYFRYEPEAQRPEPLIYFVHIPKTAGTSTHIALSQARHLRILSIQKNFGDMSIDQFNTLSNSDLDDYDIVYGHFPYGLHKRRTNMNFFHRENRYVSVVRHPAAHLLSCYYYLRDTMCDERIDPEKSIFENLAAVREPTFDNYAVRYLTGLDDSIAVKKEHLELAKSNIRENFLYIGTVEDYNNTLGNLSAYLGCKLEYFKENVTRYINERADLHPEAIEMLVDRYYGLDVELYHWITEHFSGAHWIKDLEGRSRELPISERSLA